MTTEGTSPIASDEDSAPRLKPHRAESSLYGDTAFAMACADGLANEPTADDFIVADKERLKDVPGIAEIDSILQNKADESDSSASQEGVEANASVHEHGGWWHGEGGVRQLTAIALPLVISTVSFTVMHFCDRMFLGWYSTDAMAAVMPAGALCWTLFSLPMGVAGFAATFVAQYVGAKQQTHVGPILWQAYRVGLYSIPLFLVSALVGPIFLRQFGHAPELYWMEVQYFQVVSFCSGAIVLSAGLSAFFVGRGKTRVIMFVDTLAAGLNVVLDLVLIFGWGWIPEMGIEGAAWATAASMWVKTLLLAALVFRPVAVREFALLTGRGWDGPLLGRLLKYGVPNGLQFVIEGFSITLFILFIGRIGTEAAAATTLAFSVNMLAFVPVFGLGMAVSTVVGQQIGKGTPQFAARATLVGMGMAAIYTSAFGVLYVGFPDLLFTGFAAGIVDFEEVRDLAVILLRFVAAYCLLDAIQLVFVSALKGAGDTWFVLLATGTVASLLIATGFVGARLFDWGADELFWWWAIITGWVWSIAVVFGLRFWGGKWQEMSVIEPNLLPNMEEVAAD